jgi:hypothetical protein
MFCMSTSALIKDSDWRLVATWRWFQIPGFCTSSENLPQFDFGEFSHPPQEMNNTSDFKWPHECRACKFPSLFYFNPS